MGCAEPNSHLDTPQWGGNETRCPDAVCFRLVCTGEPCVMALCVQPLSSFFLTTVRKKWGEGGKKEGLVEVKSCLDAAVSLHRVFCNAHTGGMHIFEFNLRHHAWKTWIFITPLPQKDIWMQQREQPETAEAETSLSPSNLLRHTLLYRSENPIRVVIEISEGLLASF